MMIQKIGRWLRLLFNPPRKIVVPTPPPMPDDGVYITDTRARGIIGAAVGQGNPRLADAKFYCPSKEYVEMFLEQDLVDRYKYATEIFDCDDFAWVLKARFCIDAYKHGERRSAHAMGIAWGLFPHPHAINWVITDDEKLRFIEPQTDRWIEWQDGFKVWLIAG